MYTENDPRVLRVLEDALTCGSKGTRLRAVAMLARVNCARRAEWLEAAEKDADPSVRETARAVAAWVFRPGRPVWPTREECSAGETPQHELPGLGAVVEDAVRARDGWRYIVEVWRSDGLLVGTYTATICAEDDQHAKCIALGQAVLDSTSAHGDRFEPGDAAAFIIEKRRANKVDGAGG